MTKNNNYDDDDDDLLMALQSMEPCGNCGADGAKIPCMSGCGEVFYCSRECNMHHASAHRLRCRNLRCSKFNDSESESGSDDYEEFTDDDSDDAEYETDDGEDDDDDEEEEVKPKKGAGKKKGVKGGKMKRTKSGRDDGEGGARRKISVDSDVEKRIEEKIMRRLKKQEESRIATAIEQRMREEKANWRDDEMNRIIMEMRERFQNEMSNTSFLAQLAKGKNGEGGENSAFAAALSAAMTGGGANPQSEEKMPAIGVDGVEMSKEALDAAAARNRSASKESSWNNACLAFEALRVVVWKHSFLPRIKFEKSASTGIWNSISQLDPDESFRHIEVGDVLESVNGRAIDETVQAEEDLDDVFAAFASPVVLKFIARTPDNSKVHDYTVTWSNGPLGVTLKDDCVNQKVPIVNRLTKKAGSVAVKQNITIGDVLVAINNIDTIQLGCSLSMSILKKVQLPAKLRFRGVGGPPPGSEEAEAAEEAESAASSDLLKVEKEDVNGNVSLSMSRPATYTINWSEGPLGLTIIPGFDETDLPVIKKVTGTGTSEGIEKAQVGDLLEKMNGVSTVGMHFEKVVSYLKSTPKPVLLRFRSAMGERELVAPTVPPVAQVLRVASQPAMNRGSLDSATATPFSRGSNELSRTMPLPSAASGAPPDNYKIVWGSGPLGLTIDAIPNSSGAYIKRISSQGAAAQLSQDCTGDELTHINDMDVGRIVFQDIVAHLKNVPRPVTLFFRRRGTTPVKSRAQAQAQARLSDSPAPGRKPSARDEHGGIHYYNVVWQDGTPLGLSLRGADNTCEYPYITRVTGSGSSAHLPDSVINDCLISVDGRSVHMRDKTFDEVMGMLKVMQKPLTLKFQSRGLSLQPQRPGSSSNLHAAMHQQQHQQQQQQQYQQPPPPQQYHQQQQPGGYDPRSAPPPPAKQDSHTWRQNQPAPRPMAGGGGPPQFSQSYNSAPLQASSMPTPQDRLAASAINHQNSSLSRSFLGGSERALDTAAGNEEKFSSIHSPFLVQNKLSTGRRQKMLKGLKK